jgi:hypothetical protein
MSRDDLLALSPDKLAALANRGLVKRAQRMVASGKAPSLQLDGDAVVATFDGVTTRLAPGLTLAETGCSCGATSICRHRIAAVIAYQASASAQTSARGPEVVDWSPGNHDDAELVAALGSRIVSTARSHEKRGLVVTVRRARSAGEAPRAALPTCTVVFLVPHDLAYARCDCTAAERCRHVALAVWAFRRADAHDGDATEVTVQLGEGLALTVDAETSALELCRELLLTGVARAGVQLGARFEHARRPLKRAEQRWMIDIVDELQDQLASYTNRSARYRADRVAGLITELFARSRAARSNARLPPSVIVGHREPSETALSHLRLVSLGVRLHADGDAREVDVFFADPDSATVLVFHKRLEPRGDEALETGDGLASRSLGPRLRLAAMARGQLVTALARRRANRRLMLGRDSMGKTSLTEPEPEWQALPEPLLVHDYAALTRRMTEGPPRLVDSRVLARHMHVLAIHSASAPRYHPSEQRLEAQLYDASGQAVRVVAEHRHVARHALPALNAALAGKHGEPRFIAGEVQPSAAGVTLRPTSIVCGRRLLALDIACADDGEALVVADHEAPLLDHELVAAIEGLDQLAHDGIAQATTPQRERIQRSALALERVGMHQAAEPLRVLAGRLTSGAPDERGVCDAFVEASIRLRMTATTA